MEWSQVTHVRVDGSTIQLLFVVNLQVVDRFSFLHWTTFAFDDWLNPQFFFDAGTTKPVFFTISKGTHPLSKGSPIAAAGAGLHRPGGSGRVGYEVPPLDHRNPAAIQKGAGKR